jgi:hypothetical protein
LDSAPITEDEDEDFKRPSFEVDDEVAFAPPQQQIPAVAPEENTVTPEAPAPEVPEEASPPEFVNECTQPEPVAADTVPEPSVPEPALEPVPETCTPAETVEEKAAEVAHSLEPNTAQPEVVQVPEDPIPLPEQNQEVLPVEELVEKPLKRIDEEPAEPEPPVKSSTPPRRKSQSPVQGKMTISENFDLVYVMGKGHRLVSILIPKKFLKAIKVLVDEEIRTRVGIKPENQFDLAYTRMSDDRTTGYNELRDVCNLLQ